MWRHDMPETDYRASRFCRLIGNPKTYAIIRTLQRLKEATPTELAEDLDRRVSTISMHLRNLRNLDIVRYQRKGNESVYWLKDERICDILKSLEEYIEYLRTFR